MLIKSFTHFTRILLVLGLVFHSFLNLAFAQSFPNDLIIEKSVVGSTAGLGSGSLVQYEIDYTNSGALAVSGINLLDAFGTGLTFSGVSSTSGVLPTPLLSGNTITWNSLNLAANETGAIVLDFVIDSGIVDGDILSNGSQIGLSGNTTTSCVDCPDPFYFGGGGGGGGYVYPEEILPYNLIIDKALTSTGDIVKGSIIEFTLTITNDVFTGMNIRIVDYFEDWNLGFLGVTSSSIVLPSTQYAIDIMNNGMDGLVRQGVPLSPGATETITIAFEVLTNLVSPITNYSQIGTYDPLNGDQTHTAWFDETNGLDNFDLEEIELDPFDIYIDKSIVNEQSSYMSGDLITFRFDFGNTSTVDLEDIAILDMFSNGLEYVSHTSNDGLGLPVMSYSGNTNFTTIDDYDSSPNYKFEGGRTSGFITAWTGLTLDAGETGRIELTYRVPCGYDGENYIDITFMDGAGRFLQVRDPNISCTVNQYNDCYLYLDDETLETNRHNNYDSVEFDTLGCSGGPGGPASYDWEVNSKEFTNGSGVVITSAVPGEIVYATIDATFNESGSIIRDEGYISDYRGDNYEFVEFVSNEHFFYLDETDYPEWLMEVYADSVGPNTCHEFEIPHLYNKKGAGFPLLTGGAVDFGDGTSGPYIESHDGCGFTSDPTGNSIIDANYATMYATYELAFDTAHTTYYTNIGVYYDQYLGSGYTIGDAMLWAHIDALADAYDVYLDWYIVNSGVMNDVMNECLYNLMYTVAINLGYTPSAADGFALVYASSNSVDYVVNLTDLLNHMDSEIGQILLAMGYDNLSNHVHWQFSNGALGLISAEDFRDFIIQYYSNTTIGPINDPELYYLSQNCDNNGFLSYTSDNSCGSEGAVNGDVNGVDRLTYLNDSVAADNAILPDGLGGFYYMRNFNISYLQEANIDFASDGNGLSVGGFTTCPVTDTMQMTIALEVQCPSSGGPETYVNQANVASAIFPEGNTDYYSRDGCDSDGFNVFCGYDTRSQYQETLNGFFSGNNMTTASLDTVACPDLEVSIDSTLGPSADGDNTFEPGEDLEYSVEVCNDSTVAMNNIVYTEEYNTQVLMYSGTIGNPTGSIVSIMGSTITVTDISLGAGQCVIITHDFVITPNAVNGQTFDFESNVGYEFGSDGTVVYDDSIDNNSDGNGGDIEKDPPVPPVYPGGSKNLISPSNPLDVIAGTIIVHEISITNPYPVSMNLNLIDTYNSNLTYLGIVGGSTELSAPVVDLTGRNLQRTGLSMPAGTTWSVQVQSQVNPNSIPYDVYANSYQFELSQLDVPACICSETILDNNTDIVDFQVSDGPIYDLSLVKVLSGYIDEDASGTITIGDDVEYVIRVTNQGNMTGSATEIVDYTPVGLTLNDPNWILSGGNAYYTSGVGSIAPGGDAEITITYTVNALASGTIENRAEISEDDGDDKDSTPDDTNTDNFSGDNNTDGDGTDDEDDHDPAEFTLDDPAPTVYDLALTKMLSGYVDADSSGTITVGDEVEYVIKVINQGNMIGTTTEIVDYTPLGLTLNDTSWTLSGGNAYYTSGVGPIAPGGDAEVTITYTINTSASGTITNVAEISGDDGDDIDSDTDDDKDNDEFGDDNQTDGDGTDDEDDHDPEEFVLGQAPIYDLALTKVLSGYVDVDASGTITIGDNVEYIIKVINQGDIAGTATEIVDYTPTGLTLNDVSWNLSGGNAYYTSGVGPIAPGADEEITITYTINASASGTIVNVAEISGDDGDDRDSETDDDKANDEYGDDDQTDGDGTDDEDDHDPAEFTLDEPTPGVYDLALIKKVNQTDSYALGSPVSYTITVINQGTVNAANIEITEYIPNGLILSDSNWTNNNDGTATFNNLITLNAGDDVDVTVNFIIDPSFNGTSITNYAEISNDDGDDKDSNPDNDKENDEYGDDDQTDGDGTNDEDDHDPATITVRKPKKNGGGPIPPEPPRPPVVPEEEIEIPTEDLIIVETIVEKKLEIIQIEEIIHSSAEEAARLINPITLPIHLPKTGVNQ